MQRLPEQPSLDHLKKQAKDLLRLYQDHDPAAFARLRHDLPTAAGKNDADIAALGLRLHDAQSCVAREYGFASWADLKSYVEARSARNEERADAVLRWLRLVYAGHIAGGSDRARPRTAERVLMENPSIAQGDPYLACATGDEDALGRMTDGDPGWVNRPGGPLGLPPLVAITHSGLLRLPAFRDRLHRSARLLLGSGADPNQSAGSRWPPASLSAPSEEYPLSALYGAAGENHDAEMTRLLLEAGADPNDGESLYHAVNDLACTRLLLESGARIEGTNAIYRVLDFDNLPALRLLLAHGADPNEPARDAPISDWGSPLLWAIRRRRSAAHVAALLEAGADPQARTPEGTSAYALALLFGLPEAAALLRRAGGTERLSQDEQFIAACSCGDRQAALTILGRRPDLPGALSEQQLRLLPELAAEGCGQPVELMVELGWPVSVRGGDWSASALNHAVFRGDAPLTRFLLQHGANWKEQHGHGDNVCGTLSWASCNEPVENGDWLGCAEALVAHGMPGAEPDPDGSGAVLIGQARKQFSDEVTDFLLGVATTAARP